MYFRIFSNCSESTCFFFSKQVRNVEMLFCLSLRVWLLFLYLGTLLNPWLEGISNSAVDCTSFSFLYKLIIHSFMYKCTRASTAALSLRVSQKRLLSGGYCFLTSTYVCLKLVTWLKNKAKWAISTAWSTSASSHTMNGDLPPSSRVTALRLLFEANSRIIFPTSVEPVKATCRVERIYLKIL